MSTLSVSNIVGSPTSNLGTTNASSLTVGSNFTANTTGVYHTNVVNASTHSVGSDFVANSTGIYHTSLVNTATVSTTNVNATTVNGSTITVGSHFTANSTIVNAASGAFTINSTALTYTPNTFNMGSSSKTANGYTWLPNGLLMQWGVLVVNTTSSATFSQSFPTGVLSVTVTPIGTSLIGANTPRVIAANTTVANITSTTTLTTNTAYYLAIGY